MLIVGHTLISSQLICFHLVCIVTFWKLFMRFSKYLRNLACYSEYNDLAYILCLHFVQINERVPDTTKHENLHKFLMEFVKIAHILADSGTRNNWGHWNFLFWQIYNRYFEIIGTEIENHTPWEPPPLNGPPPYTEKYCAINRTTQNIWLSLLYCNTNSSYCNK